MTATKRKPAARKGTATKRAPAKRGTTSKRTPVARGTKAPTLRIALLQALTKEERPVKEVIAEALTHWAPPKKGLTPDRTAATQLLALQRLGVVVKPEKGRVKLHPGKKEQEVIAALLRGERVTH